MLKIREKMILAVFIILFYFLLFLLHIGCPIKFVTGISCPFCGMTRAWTQVLEGNLAMAFYYHPLFVLGPLFLVGLLFEDVIPLSDKIKKSILLAIVLILVVVYIYRIMFMLNSPISFDIKNSFVLQFYYILTKGG